jgi:alkylhydroperoxidase family enzyme
VGSAEFLKPIVGDGALPGGYKEVIAVRVCLLHHFEYGLRAHSISAQKRASTEHLNGVQDFEQGPFTEAQKIGVRYADRLHRSPAEIDDQFYAAVKSVYNDLQIIELTAVAAAFEFFPRFIDALRIPITPPPTQSAQLSEVAGELRVRGQKESL